MPCWPAQSMGSPARPLCGVAVELAVFGYAGNRRPAEPATKLRSRSFYERRFFLRTQFRSPTE